MVHDGHPDLDVVRDLSKLVQGPIGIVHRSGNLEFLGGDLKSPDHIDVNARASASTVYQGCERKLCGHIFGLDDGGDCQLVYLGAPDEFLRFPEFFQGSLQLLLR